MSIELNIKDINKLAIPAIMYNITEPLIGLADTAIIGQMPDDATIAQGGVGLAVGLISTLVWGLAQIRTAVSAIVSKYLGMDKLAEVRSLIPQALAFSLVLGLFFWWVTDGFYNEIADFLFSNNSTRTQEYSQKYYHIRAIGLPLSLFIAGVFGVFRGYQNTSWAMIISFVGGGTNIILDLILVNGAGTFIPAYGVEGAAYASLASQLIMAIMGGWFLVRRTPFDLKLSFKISPEFWNMFTMAMNMLVRTLALNVTFLLALRYASGYGEDELAAYAIGINIWLFSSFFIDGYSNAGNAIAGKLLGKKDYANLKWLGWKLMRVNIKISIGLGLVYLLAYPIMAKIFNDDVAVQRIFNSFFWLVLLALPINSIAFTFDGIFKGLGEASFLRNVLLLGTFLIFIPVLMLMDKWGLEIFSIWIAFLCWMIWRASALMVKFKKILEQS